MPAISSGDTREYCKASLFPTTFPNDELFHLRSSADSPGSTLITWLETMRIEAHRKCNERGRLRQLPCRHRFQHNERTSTGLSSEPPIQGLRTRTRCVSSRRGSVATIIPTTLLGAPTLSDTPSNLYVH